MNRMTRRIATIVAAGAFALPTLAACGAAEQAVDCANLTGTVTESIGSIAGDPAALKDQATKLREQAADVGDAELKEAVNTLADHFDRLAELQEKAANAPASLTPAEAEEMTKLAGDIPTQAGTITTKCSDVTS
ncbi:hypothetical protein AB0I28_28325 [Phytomonospora sp. NPDC050363]|uniref:hypothetical protein n=1 Tax=Phytomonospora sp. NPDC050363 TaxID=3155642 RepID=UPI0033D28F98